MTTTEVVGRGSDSDREEGGGRREINLTKRAFLNEEVVPIARAIDIDGRASRY